MIINKHIKKTKKQKQKQKQKKFTSQPLQGHQLSPAAMVQQKEFPLSMMHYCNQYQKYRNHTLKISQTL